ncbi:hypothetical protein TNCT_435781 [Trichonephila clavata]|uniref:Uncharacterized protein n=1 Tax=Trichonephila clavata TaxID=2740835 RepID=A0A8X6KRJ8_TRICU|nr:hypothetical protein TNCT_435781 [Trichonephila clavata]
MRGCGVQILEPMFISPEHETPVQIYQPETVSTTVFCVNNDLISVLDEYESKLAVVGQEEFLNLDSMLH